MNGSRRELNLALLIRITKSSKANRAAETNQGRRNSIRGGAYSISQIPTCSSRAEGARLQQVSRPTVAQRVRGDALADAGPTRGIATCNPDGFVRNGLIESGLTGAGGEQIESGLPPAPVLTQGFQQGWTQRQITILAALAFHHADDHPLAIDIADFETSQFAASHAGGVERHQQSSSKQGSRRIDQSRNFLPAEHRRQTAPVPGVGQELAKLMALECLDEKEAQRRYPVDHRARCQLALRQ